MCALTTKSRPRTCDTCISDYYRYTCYNYNCQCGKTHVHSPEGYFADQSIRRLELLFYKSYKEILPVDWQREVWGRIWDQICNDTRIRREKLKYFPVYSDDENAERIMKYGTIAFRQVVEKYNYNRIKRLSRQ